MLAPALRALPQQVRQGQPQGCETAVTRLRGKAYNVVREASMRDDARVQMRICDGFISGVWSWDPVGL